MANTLNQKGNNWLSSVLHTGAFWSGLVSAVFWVIAAVAGIFNWGITAGISGILAALTGAWAWRASSQIEQELGTRVVEGAAQRAARIIDPDQREYMVDALYG